MKRRNFIRNLATIPLLNSKLFIGSTLLANMKKACATTGKTLIVIFQRGGCDGINMVVPHGEDEYYNLRPDISIGKPGSGSGEALDLDGFFGLHPSLTGLYDIYQQGHLAIFPTTHYEKGNRSHFSSQDFIESGTSNIRLNDGWLNRHLSTLKNTANTGIRAISFGGLSHALQGNQPVTAINSISNFGDGLENLELDILRQVYEKNMDSDPNSLLIRKEGSLALNNFALMKDNSDFLTNFDTKNYIPDNNAVYPDTEYGQQLQEIAILIKSGIGLEVATINSNGWDHHVNQGGAQGKQANRMKDFSDGIEALYRDLGVTYMNDVIILTMTEFGRTAKQNASKGTDHGNASSWFVIGQQINGGIYGDWPGLLPEQLYKGRYLRHTIKYTNILGEILANHLENQPGLNTVLPGSNYKPIGFL